MSATTLLDRELAAALVDGDKELAKLVLRVLYRGTRYDVEPQLPTAELERLAGYTSALWRLLRDEEAPV